jgi:hypothetical protein
MSRAVPMVATTFIVSPHDPGFVRQGEVVIADDTPMPATVERP